MQTDHHRKFFLSRQTKHYQPNQRNSQCGPITGQITTLTQISFHSSCQPLRCYGAQGQGGISQSCFLFVELASLRTKRERVINQQRLADNKQKKPPKTAESDFSNSKRKAEHYLRPVKPMFSFGRIEALRKDGRDDSKSSGH